MSQLPNIAIIELGGQYTLLIERTLRELGVRSVILDPKRADRWLKEHPLKAVILSGGHASVYDENAPSPPKSLVWLRRSDHQLMPILGICYGMQWLAHHLGGQVKPVLENRDYGRASITVSDKSLEFFSDTPKTQQVWMSHGDSVIAVPAGFQVMARTDEGTIAAMQNGPVWGVQFHPEVHHTIFGKTILQNFLRFAQCQKDWAPSSIVDDMRDKVIRQLGDRRAIFGFSGGVDSTMVAASLAPVLKDRLLAVTIDGGNLREGELKEIQHHAKVAGVNHRVIDAREEFGEAMADVIDAEQKRCRFKAVYASLLTRAAMESGAGAILQGTLGPDRIESGATGGDLIKSHHNVGLDFGDLLQLHPIDHLFKYEVRALAQGIGLPESVWNRQPFPGPGLFIRVIGIPATPDKLEIVRWADARVREILARHPACQKYSQGVIDLIGVKTVGVKGDKRVYGYPILVRAVKTIDFMTAEGVYFPEAVVKEIKKELPKHPEVVRAWFDPTDKPPATVELE